MRIGQGFDVHAFSPNRPLVIGGVTIEYELGLAGHSDADVLLHAICDALLGALALGDIGKHFPDTENVNKNRDSREFLRKIYALVQSKGYTLVNLDCTIIAQLPKFAPHIDAMRSKIAKDLQADMGRVSVKATTTEHLGFTGRKEGIAAQAVVLLEKI